MSNISCRSIYFYMYYHGIIMGTLWLLMDAFLSWTLNQFNIFYWYLIIQQYLLFMVANQRVCSHNKDLLVECFCQRHVSKAFLSGSIVIMSTSYWTILELRFLGVNMMMLHVSLAKFVKLDWVVKRKWGDCPTRVFLHNLP